MKTILARALSLVLALCSASVQSQTTIDFESLPDGSSTSGGTVISNQFEGKFGVSFKFEDGSFPVIRKVGARNNSGPTAFYGWPDNTGNNTPAPGQNIASYFISDSAKVDEPPPPLIVSYSTAVSAASGFILDIDHQEAWDVVALDDANQELSRIHLENGSPPKGFTGDGIATPWLFNRTSPDIKTIRIVFTGNTNKNVGLAFDNFSPASGLPVPARCELSPSIVSNQMHLSIFGTPLAVYSIQAAESVTSTNWEPVTSVVMDSPTFILTNLPSNDLPNRFFRAVGFDGN